MSGSTMSAIALLTFSMAATASVDGLPVPEPGVEDACIRHAMCPTGVRLEPDADTDEVVRQIRDLIFGVQEVAPVCRQLRSLERVLRGPCRVIRCIFLHSRDVRQHHVRDSLVDLLNGSHSQCRWSPRP